MKRRKSINRVAAQHVPVLRGEVVEPDPEGRCGKCGAASFVYGECAANGTRGYRCTTCESIKSEAWCKAYHEKQARDGVAPVRLRRTGPDARGKLQGHVTMRVAVPPANPEHPSIRKRSRATNYVVSVKMEVIVTVGKKPRYAPDKTWLAEEVIRLITAMGGDGELTTAEHGKEVAGLIDSFEIIDEVDA